MVRWSAILLLLLSASRASAQTLQWDANMEPPAIAGYQVLSGPTSGNYTNAVSVGNVTSYILPPIMAPTYVVVKAMGADGLISPPSAEVVYAPAVPVPVPIPTPVPTCKDGSAIFPQGFTEWVYTKVSGSFTTNADYKRLTLAGWIYVEGSAYRQRANYYNLQFRCGA